MQKIKPFLFFVFTLFIFISTGLYSAEPDNEIIRAKSLSSYDSKLGRPFAEKIMPAPDILLRYLRAIDETDTYKNHTLEKNELDMVLSYFKLIHPAIRKVVEEKAAGIFFVENFAGGGMTDYVRDDNGNIYNIIIFNPKTLKVTLTEWIQYRDGSPFKEDASGITVQSEASAAYKGFLHTLVHETVHLYDYQNHLTPYIENSLKKEGKGSLIDGRMVSDFTKMIWSDINTPLEKYDFENRIKVKPYGFGPPLDYNAAEGLYKSLSDNVFASLYATSNWAEDAAELITWNYLYDTLKIKYTVKVFKGKELRVQFSPTENKNVRERYKKIKL
jgi:hypothetical protein